MNYTLYKPGNSHISVLSKTAVSCWLLLLATGIVYMFWQSEWKYKLPTKIPDGYKVVSNGTYIQSTSLQQLKTGKPLFLNFFNPACPCSRFNMPYFKSLSEKYGDEVTFAVVLVNPDEAYTEKEIQEKYGLTIRIITDQSLAKACGVYSTPQAVILNSNQQLFYRGNFNRSRYCTDAKTNFAEAALNSVLLHSATVRLEAAAYKSYGCQLPGCSK